MNPARSHRVPRTVAVLTLSAVTILGVFSSTGTSFAESPQIAASADFPVVDSTWNPEYSILSEGYETSEGPDEALPVGGASNSISEVVTPASRTQDLVQWPLSTGNSNITDGFGPRVAPCSSCSSNHRGLDFGGASGMPIGSIAAGVVSEVSYTDGGGLGVYVRVDHVIDGKSVRSSYGHMLVGSVTVKVGDSVKVGDQLGSLGNTGSSTGPHLHLEIQISGVHVDPYAFLSKYADGKSVSINEKGVIPAQPAGVSASSPVSAAVVPAAEVAPTTPTEAAKAPESAPTDVPATPPSAPAPITSEPAVTPTPAPSTETTSEPEITTVPEPIETLAPSPVETESPTPAEEETPVNEPVLEDVATADPTEEPAPTPEAEELVAE